MNNSNIFDSNNNIRQRKGQGHISIGDRERGEREGNNNILTSKIFTNSLNNDFSPSRNMSSVKKIGNQIVTSSTLTNTATNGLNGYHESNTPNISFSSPPRGLPRNSLLTSSDNELSNSLNFSSSTRKEFDNELDFSSNHFSIKTINSNIRDGNQRENNFTSFSQQQPQSNSQSSNYNFINREDIHEGASLLTSISRQNYQQNLHQQHNGLDIKDSNTLDQIAGLADRTPLSAEASLWPHWVIIFGFNPHSDRDSPSSLQNILRLFQEFGEIDDYSPGAGNWLFIRFSSARDADRVLILDNTFLTPHMMIGVRKLNSKIAREMNVSIRADGRLTQGGIDEITRESLAGAAYRRELDPNYDVIMKPPKKSKDICTRIFEYFMAY